MHELSVCQALITQVEAIARERQAHRVTSILLEMGPFSGVEPSLLEQAFPIASAGTIAAGAALVIKSLPVRVHCDQCGHTTDALPYRLLCGHCGDWKTQLVSGDELQLTSVELARTTSHARQTAATL